MTERKVYLYTLLDNEKIGKQTYWGNFKTDSFYPESIAQNVINRNNFYKDFNVKSCTSGGKLTQKKLNLFNIDNLIEITKYTIGNKTIADHREYYKTKDNKCIFLFSNYYYKDNEIIILLNNGYREYPSLYGTCRTFYKIV